MKNLLCSIIAFLVFSCSTDSDLDKSEYNSNKISNLNIDSVLPENKLNPFDAKGKKYYNALNLYYQNNQFPSSINDMTQQIKFVSGDIASKGMASKGVILFNDEIVQSIMNDPDNILIAIVENSSLGTQAKTYLINFLQNLIQQRMQDFTVAYQFIISFEADILQSTTLTQGETETILTVASISRYSLYSESERKDRDWETSVGSKKVGPFFEKNETSVISIIAFLETIL